MGQYIATFFYILIQSDVSIYQASVWSVFSITPIHRSYDIDTVVHIWNLVSGHMQMHAVSVSANPYYFLNLGTLLF